MMKQEDLFKKLGLILNELNEQYQFLAQNPQQLNELELELFHANANFLADHVQIVKKMASSQHAPLILPPASEEAIAKNEIDQDVISEQYDEKLNSFLQEESPLEIEALPAEVELTESLPKDSFTEPSPKIEDIEQEIFRLDNSPSTFEFILNDHSEHAKFDFEEKTVDELFNRPLSDEEARVIAEKKKLSEHTVKETKELDEDEIGPEPFLVHREEEVVEDAPIALEDLKMVGVPAKEFQPNKTEPVEDPTFKPTLNDTLAGRSSTPESINSTSSTKITDLKLGINLNDKLLYIKDLFNGYNLAYAEAIELANKLPNFEAADNFFQKNYASKNNWSAKQGTVDKFYGLLNQRFKV